MLLAKRLFCQNTQQLSMEKEAFSRIVCIYAIYQQGLKPRLHQEQQLNKQKL